jgi:hypothetical protein
LSLALWLVVMGLNLRKWEEEARVWRGGEA